MCPKSKQLKRQRHRKQGAPGGKVYSTESIKTEGEENETEGVEKEPGTVDHKTMTADIKEEVGITLVDISKKTRKQRALVNTLVKSLSILYDKEAR
jgi:hypothetical protein